MITTEKDLFCSLRFTVQVVIVIALFTVQVVIVIHAACLRSSDDCQFIIPPLHAAQNIHFSGGKESNQLVIKFEGQFLNKRQRFQSIWGMKTWKQL